MIATSERCGVPSFISIPWISIPWIPITFENCGPLDDLAGVSPLSSLRACCLPRSLIPACLPGLLGSPTLLSDVDLLGATLLHVARSLLLSDMDESNSVFGSVTEKAGGFDVVVARVNAVEAARSAICRLRVDQRSDAITIDTLSDKFSEASLFVVGRQNWGRLFRLLDAKGGEQNLQNCTVGQSATSYVGGNCGGFDWLVAVDLNSTEQIGLAPRTVDAMVSARDHRYARNVAELVQQILSPDSKFGVNGPLFSVFASLTAGTGADTELISNLTAERTITQDVKPLTFSPFLPKKALSSLRSKAACGAGRIAIVLTGLMRTIMECLSRLEEYLILPNQADVFFYVSVSEGESDKVQILKNKSYVKAFVIATNLNYDQLVIDHPDLP